MISDRNVRTYMFMLTKMNKIICRTLIYDISTQFASECQKENNIYISTNLFNKRKQKKNVYILLTNFQINWNRKLIKCYMTFLVRKLLDTENYYTEINSALNLIYPSYWWTQNAAYSQNVTFEVSNPSLKCG